MSRAIATLLALLCLAPLFPLTRSAQSASIPKRVVSINLCTDQYLLELADPGQILALSPFAADPALSYYAERAKPFPRITDSAETVLTLKPDLVLASSFNNPATLTFLRRQGVSVLTLSYADGFADISAQAQVIAAALGQPARGDAFAARLNAAQALAASATRAAPPLAALYIERGGYVAGAVGLMNELLEAEGVINAAVAMGTAAQRPLTPFPIEAILTAHPDFLIVADDGSAASGEGAALLAHPALARAYPASKRLNWPIRDTVCPGPSVIGAFERLADGVTRMAQLRRLP
jgi:iron complex transport system substrate-binding protein